MTAPFRNIIVFKEIFKKFYNPLVNFVNKRYLNDYDLSAEITRATFIKIWKNKEDIILETSIRNFLFKAVKNEALAYLKSISDSAIEINTRDTPFGIIDDRFEVDCQLVIYQQIMVSAIDKMDSHMRSIFEMYKFDEFSLMDIAVKLNITKTKVSENIRQAFFVINKELANSGLLN